MCVCACRVRVVLCGRIGREIASVCCAWPASEPMCCGRLCARAVCVISGCAGSESLSGCAGAVACGCGAPCVRAGVAVERPEWALGLLACIVCAVVGAARAAAVRRRAGGEAVLGVPVRSRGVG